MRKDNEVYKLISLFSKLWEQEYKEDYIKSPKDFKQAKNFLEMNPDYKQDMIVQRTKEYLKKDSIWSENRHTFAAFITNIASFAPEKARRKYMCGRGCGKGFNSQTDLSYHEYTCRHDEKTEVPAGVKQLINQVLHK